MGEELRAFLAGRDAACPRCGYNLRGLVGAECPECGLGLSLARLRARVEHAEWRESRLPRDPITTAGLIGSILGLGWPLAVLTLGILFRDSEAMNTRRLLALGLVCVVQVGMVAVYLGGLTRMKPWPRRGKVALAVAAWCWGPGAMVGMVVWGMVM